MEVHVVLPYQLDEHEYRARFEAGLAADASPWGFARARQLGYRVTFSKALRGRLTQTGLPSPIRRILHVLRERQAIGRADVVWTHTELEYMPIALLRRLRLVSRRPLLIGNSLWIIMQMQAAPKWVRAMFRWVSHEVDLFTFNAVDNHAAAEQLVTPTARRAYIPFGICVDSFPLSNQATAQGKDLPRTVLVAGNDPARDWIMVREVAKRLSHHNFVIASADTPPELQALSNVKGLRPHGPVEMRKLYNSADLLMLLMKPNLHASGITVLLEAVTQQLPAVVTQSEGLRAYFNENEVAAIDADADADAVAAIVEKLLNDGEWRATLATGALKRFRADDYSSDGFVRRLAQATEVAAADRSGATYSA